MKFQKHMWNLFKKKSSVEELTSKELAILQRENEESRLHAMPDNLETSISINPHTATPKLRQSTLQNGMNGLISRRFTEPREKLPTKDQDSI